MIVAGRLYITKKKEKKMIQRQNFKEQHILAPAYENTSLK